MWLKAASGASRKEMNISSGVFSIPQISPEPTLFVICQNYMTFSFICAIQFLTQSTGSNLLLAVCEKLSKAE